MKRAMIATVLTLTGAALPAYAMTADANGDGAISMEEIKQVHPDVTEDVFAAIDADADGSVSEEEYQAAVEAGVLAKKDG